MFFTVVLIAKHLCFTKYKNKSKLWHNFSFIHWLCDCYFSYGKVFLLNPLMISMGGGLDVGNFLSYLVGKTANLHLTVTIKPNAKHYKHYALHFLKLFYFCTVNYWPAENTNKYQWRMAIGVNTNGVQVFFKGKFFIKKWASKTTNFKKIFSLQCLSCNFWKHWFFQELIKSYKIE